MSYESLAALVRQYRSLPDEGCSFQRLSAFARLLDHSLACLMVELVPGSDTGPPDIVDPSVPDTYGQSDRVTSWFSTFSAAELNSAGIAHQLGSGSEASSTSNSTSTRPRALTNSSNDNPRAPKRRANPSLQSHDQHMFGSTASERVGTPLPAHMDHLRLQVNAQDGGRVQLPPLRFPSGSAGSNQTGLRPSISPSKQSRGPFSNVLPPIHSAPASPAMPLGSFDNVHRSAPQTPFFPTTTLASAEFSSPVFANTPGSLGSIYSGSSVPPLSASFRSIQDRSPLGTPYMADLPPVFHGQPPVDRAPSLVFSISSDSRAPVNTRAPAYWDESSSYDIESATTTNPQATNDWATSVFDANFSRTAPDLGGFATGANTSFDPHALANSEIRQAEMSAHQTTRTHSHHGASASRSRVAAQPVAQPVYQSGPRRASTGTASAHGQPAGMLNTTYLSNVHASGRHPRLSSRPQAAFTPPPRVKIERTPPTKDDIIDLTMSSSPPEAATLFGPPRIKHEAGPLIKQESIPLIIFDGELADLPPEIFEPDNPEPEQPEPEAPELGAAVPKRKKGRKPKADREPVYSWKMFPGGYYRYISEDARNKLFSSDRDGCRWILPEDGFLINTYFPGLDENAKLEVLRDALKPPKKVGKETIVAKSFTKLSVGTFQSRRSPHALHNRLRILCFTYGHSQLAYELIGGKVEVDLSSPESEVESIQHLNEQFKAFSSQHPELEELHGWTYINFTKGDEGTSWRERMHRSLHDHPTFRRLSFRSGRVSPPPLMNKAFWVPDASGTDKGASAGHATSGTATSTSSKGKGRGAPRIQAESFDNSVVEGSVSSLPSAPSTVSEPASSISAPRTGTPSRAGSGFVVPRQFVPPRSATRTSASGRGTTNSVATHSPPDLSQGSRVETLREIREVGVQGTANNVYLLHREQDMVRDIRQQEHSLKTRRVEMEEEQTRAEMELKSRKQFGDFLLQLRASGPRGENDPLMEKANSMLLAMLDASTPTSPSLNLRTSNNSGPTTTDAATNPAPRAESAGHLNPSVSDDLSWSCQTHPPTRQPSQTPGSGPSTGPRVSCLSPRPEEFGAASADQSEGRAGTTSAYGRSYHVDYDDAEASAGGLAKGWGHM
ncbi:hypothetical protein FRC09_002589 [Ceratobasidium sp. 395]|nr:hypothetical protein FRC09_002589 [Ceratobasidium sp. 395]